VTLRTRLALALMVLSALATASVGTLAYVSTGRQLTSQIDSNLRDIATTYASTQPGGRGGSGGDGGRGAVQLQTVLVQQLDSDGSVQSSPTGISVPVTAADRALAARGSGQLYRDVTLEGHPYRLLTIADEHGAVQALRPLAESQKVLEDLRLRILLAVIVVVLAAAAAGWLVSRQVTRRLRELAAAASLVAETGRLDVRTRADGRDETGQLARAFTAMLAALDRSQSAQRRLVQDAGHELRTPLTSLQTNLDVLRRHPDLDVGQQGQILTDLHSETRELTLLVNELVELSLGAGNETPPEHIWLAELAARVIARARRRTDRTITLEADDSAAYAPQSQLDRALANLVDNAVKFSPDGTTIDVTIDHGRLTVRDRGPGVEDADVERVFDRFYRADAARQLPGSGLGLSIVQEIVTRAGGTVFAGNHPTGGAAIGFKLPPAAFQPSSNPDSTSRLS
jgi:two-component system sensor histidine kinase MprB